MLDRRALVVPDKDASFGAHADHCALIGCYRQLSNFSAVANTHIVAVALIIPEATKAARHVHTQALLRYCQRSTYMLATLAYSYTVKATQKLGLQWTSPQNC